MKARDGIGLAILAGGAILFAVRSGWIGSGLSESVEAMGAAMAGMTRIVPVEEKPVVPVGENQTVPVEEPIVPPKGEFATPWQYESQFIVQTIATDLAEMMVFAKSGRPPGKEPLKIQVVETRASHEGAWIYRVTLPDLQVTEDLPIDAAIWSPSVYQPLARALVKKLAVTASASVPSGDMIERLTDLRATVIEQANLEVSEALQKDFSSPALHERAALVLAAFTLREHSSMFFEIRTELCAMTAHLTLARALRAGGIFLEGPLARALRADDGSSIEGRLAATALATLHNNEADALELLEGLATVDAPGLSAWRQALRTRNTSDFRLIKDTPEISLLERLEKFNAESDRGNNVMAWEQVSSLRKSWKPLPDWMRITISNDFSVGVGRALLDDGLRSELNEIQEVYALAQGPGLGKQNLVAILNVEPGRCVSTAPNGQPQVRVIDWGGWAAFLQRRLCQTIVGDFKVLNKKMSLPKEARAFRDKADAEFGGLRLYPFVRRQNATDEAYYHQAQDDSMAVIRRQPHLIPAKAWADVSSGVPFAPRYVPPPHSLANDWHRDNPPPGTAYDPLSRASHDSLINQPDTVMRLQRLHGIAPWDHNISFYLLWRRYRDHATAEQMLEIYRPEIEYTTSAMVFVARASETNPAAYVEWMTKAAAQDPVAYFQLGDYLVKQGRDEEAARAYINGMARDADLLDMASAAQWMVNYFEDHGETANATALADRAAEVYSMDGLLAKASLFERRKQYEEAFAIHWLIAGRYNRLEDLLAFLIRMKKIAPNSKYETVFATLLAESQPGGAEKIELKDLAGAPSVGVVPVKENEEMKKAGLRQTDVIVAVQGYRVKNYSAYIIFRELGGTELNLIIWRDNAYMALMASPPHRHFGVDFRDYHADN